MESNKDEAVRCIQIAKDALKSGDKKRALRFLRIARRLDPEIPVEDLLTACDQPDAAVAPNSKPGDPTPAGREREHTEESVRLIGEIRRQKDYYGILGVGRGCSDEEIRKAYRRLSLKIHPDKSKAPGSEEAFKIVCEAFKCLSDAESRRRYDSVGFADGLERNPYSSNGVKTRRRRKGREEFRYEELDPDEVLRSFFFGSGGDVYRARHGYRPRAPVPRERRATGSHVKEFGFVNFLHLVPFLVMFLILYLPFSEPDYVLQKNYNFQIPKVVENHGVEYYVKSPGFDREFPPGSSARRNLEQGVLKDHRSMLARYCHVELQRRRWARNYPTPHCVKLRELGAA